MRKRGISLIVLIITIIVVIIVINILFFSINFKFERDYKHKQRGFC